MGTLIKRVIFLLIMGAVMSLDAAPAFAFKFIPPKNIILKQKLPIDGLNLIRTKQGLTYLISNDGRYVFQGALVDVWNGEQIESIGEMNKLSDRVGFDYLGIKAEKMFTLNLGAGEKEVFIFSDPNCSICHELLKKIRDSKLIKSHFLVRAVITPVLRETSMEKSKKLFGLAQKDPNAAVDAFINNNFGNEAVGKETIPGIEYNLLVAKALGIRNFPYIVNANGRIHIGMPDEIFLFLSQ